MDDVSAVSIQFVLHNDDETPLEFVVALLHSVFKTEVPTHSGLPKRSTNRDGQFAGPLRLTLPTNCWRRFENASVQRGSRS